MNIHHLYSTLPSFMIVVFCFVAALIFGSLIEYWVHRWMHNSYRVGRVHSKHHHSNCNQGVIREFMEYAGGSSIFMWPIFFISLEVGLSWSIGILVYAAFSAYSHQLQHDNPSRCFWTRIHYIHHKYNMEQHNFGLAMDVWDRVFGTYKPYKLEPLEEELLQAEKGYLDIKWW
ncbi:MAG: sterol desaturase family protein [Nostoc sp.]|uniref:sterol desaturase family protein n=1 Tax=Nostoc sp. TaxID=1180 RepID=UPI002FF2BBA8